MVFYPPLGLILSIGRAVKLLQTLNNLIGALVSIAVLAFLAVVVWFGYETFYVRQSLQRDLLAKDQEIQRLGKELEAKQREIARLETAVRLLKVDYRLAYLDVLEQQGAEKEGNLHTTLRFTEVDQQGNPLQRREFTIQGDIVHVDGLVVKFDDRSIEEADPLRSTSLFLFKRVYGDKQKPEEGFSIDRQGAQPAAYATGRPMSDFEREIWDKFWEYANDAEKQAKAGIRAAHGQGVYQKVIPGKRYRLQLRASDGLSLVPEDGPKPTAPAF